MVISVDFISNFINVLKLFGIGVGATAIVNIFSCDNRKFYTINILL